MIDGGVDAKRVVGAEEVETAVSRLRYYGLINVLVSCRKKGFGLWILLTQREGEWCSISTASHVLKRIDQESVK
ncbi:hypothetical protein GYH30_040684 [Glycine max]|nr:hypothetical protein GYH30_040684 [Glycine max]